MEFNYIDKEYNVLRGEGKKGEKLTIRHISSSWIFVHKKDWTFLKTIYHVLNVFYDIKQGGIWGCLHLSQGSRKD